MYCLKKNNFLKNFFIFSLIFFSCVASYSNNLFKATSNSWFNKHQIDSEQLVLDGLMHANNNNIKPALGKYIRNNNDKKDYLNARIYFDNGNTNGIFQNYNSSYGLQVKIFNLFYSNGYKNISTYHYFSSILMALIVTLMSYVVKRDFSTISGILFSLVFIFSPWLIVFAKNLFWLPFTWFMPIFFSMYFAPYIFKSLKKYLYMIFFLYFSFLLKFLCGYEFITTIFISTLVPIIYYAILKKYSYFKIIKKCSIIFIIFLLSFISSIKIQFLNKSFNMNDIENPIISSAKARLWANEPKKIASQHCNGNNDCILEISKSLKTNPLLVVSKYFLMVDFLPWTYSEKVDDKHKLIIKESLKKINNNLNYKNLVLFYNEILKILSFNLILFFIFKLISLLSFLLFIIYAIILSLKLNNHYRYYILVSLIAPMSWFIIAKGHSSIHLHMNFVLWYIMFIPNCFVFLSNHFLKNNG